MIMNNCNWEAIHGFVSPGEFQRFCAWLEAQIQSGAVDEIEVNKENSSMPFGFEEKWFRCKSSGEVWRRVAPEFPFRGLWEAIDVTKQRQVQT
jgi:hypothetical protein